MFIGVNEDDGGVCVVGRPVICKGFYKQGIASTNFESFRVNTMLRGVRATATYQAELGIDSLTTSNDDGPVQPGLSRLGWKEKQIGREFKSGAM